MRVLGVDELGRAAERADGYSDPTRLRLAVALGEAGELYVCDLAWIGERQDKIGSHHLRLLRQAGLVRSRSDGRMVLHSLTEAGVELLTSVVELEAAR